MSTVQQQIRGVSSSPPVPSSILNTISDLLTPGPNAKDIAHVAHTLGVKPLSTAAAEAVDRVADTAHDLGRGIKLAAKLPDQRVDSFLGRETLGTPSVKEILKAATHAPQARKSGPTTVASKTAGRPGLTINKAGELVTPRARQAVRQLGRLEAKRARLAGPLPGLSPAGSRVARTVFRVGEAQNESLKEMLAAAETGLVETGGTFENLNYGDADSRGWRQERASIYGDDAIRPKQGALNFFEETDQQSGATAGELAANVQRPAAQYRGRYDEVKPEAMALLRAFEEGGKPSPKLAAEIKEAVANVREVGIDPKALAGQGSQEYGKPAPEVVSRFQAGLKAAKQLNRLELPYSWGGGHASFAPGGEGENGGAGYDCSGAVSYVLHAMNVLDAPLTSGSMGQVLRPGPGAITVYYNDTHTFMRIGKRFFGTSNDNQAGGAGFFTNATGASQVGAGTFAVGHVPGLGKKVALQLGIKPGELTGGGAVPGMAVSADGTTAAIEPGAGVMQGKPGYSNRPIAPASSAQVPISQLLATQSLTPAAYDQYQLGAAPEEGDSATGMIARILARKRL